jgi:hypothetical protein
MGLGFGFGFGEGKLEREETGTETFGITPEEGRTGDSFSLLE